MKKLMTNRNLVVLTMTNGRTVAIKPRAVVSINETENGNTVIATDTGGVFHVEEPVESVLEMFKLEEVSDEESN